MPDQSFRTARLKIQLTSSSRRESRAGVEYAVYPVVLIVEGVHHGAIGNPVYYPASVLEDSAADWNGMPLPVHHPQDASGNYVLCSDPFILQEWSIGFVDNVHWDSGKLRGEVFIDVLKCNNKHPELLAELDSGVTNMEVSTGLLALDDGLAGTWNDERYSASITRIQPDHLALLPGGRGACDWNDGCGIRANRQETNMPLIGTVSKLKAQLGEGKFNKEMLHGLLSVNELSHEGIRDQLRAHVDSLDEFAANGDYVKIHWVVAVYDNYFIYRMDADGGTTLFKQNYTVGADDQLVLSDAVVPVTENVTYSPVTVNKTNQKEEVVVMAKCCPEKVEALIANEHSAFVEADRVWLTEQDESHIDKMVANMETAEPEDIVDTQVNTDVKVNTDEPAQPVTVEQFLASAPAEISGVLAGLMANQTAEKGKLVAQILAHEPNTLTEVQLQGMDVVALASIAGMIPSPAGTFAGLNNGEQVPTINTGAGGDKEAYVAPTFNMAADGK